MSTEPDFEKPRKHYVMRTEEKFTRDNPKPGEENPGKKTMSGPGVRISVKSRNRPARMSSLHRPNTVKNGAVISSFCSS